MKGTVALVTGGAGHLGRETGRSLAARGVALAVLDKNAEAGARVAAEVTSEFGVEAEALEIDLMEPAAFAQVRSRLQGRFGRLDFVVNNAAFYDDAPGWGVPFEQEGYEAWLKVLRVNLLAPFFLVQSLAPLLKESKVASVVNVASIYGVVGPDHRLYEGTDMTNPAVYSASKGGLIQLTKWLSTVLAPAVRVNAVSPGGIERGQAEAFLRRYREKTPLGRLAVEADIARAIVFLLSPEASYITGQNLVVDGGWTVW